MRLEESLLFLGLPFAFPFPPSGLCLVWGGWFGWVWSPPLVSVPCSPVGVGGGFCRGGLGFRVPVPQPPLPLPRVPWSCLVDKMDAVLITPPCNSFSRSTWSNSRGPAPCRSAQFPLGFPWMSDSLKARAELGNVLVAFTWEVLQRFQRINCMRFCLGFTEHPEDLGRVNYWDPASCPASIWNCIEVRQLVADGWQTRALHQGPFGAITVKPTRIVFNHNAFNCIGVPGWPSFDSQGKYSGPLGPMSNPPGVSIMRQQGEVGAFRTSALSAYPSKLCKLLAQCILFSWSNSSGPSLSAGVCGSMGKKNIVLDQGSVSPVAVSAKDPLGPADSVRKVVILESGDDSSGSELDLELAPIEDGEAGPELDLELAPIEENETVVQPPPITMSPEDAEIVKTRWWGIGQPMKIASASGSGRYVRDGGGFCSPGRWAPSKRVLPPEAAHVTKLLDDLMIEFGGKAPADTLVLRTLLGRTLEPPLEGIAATGRARLRKMLESAGYQFGLPRIPGTAIDFELLEHLASWLKDPDSTVAGKCRVGVRIGYDMEMDRNPEIWPRKTKWKLSPEDCIGPKWENMNYSSAKDRPEILEAEFDKQLKAKMMVVTTYGEAKAKYGERLRVAPMAVIDELDSHRVIHDASHFVFVNHLIKVQDHELCPSAADVSGALSMDGLAGPATYLALKSDVSKAHRRIPVCEEDWGLQACAIQEMPKENLDSWALYLNTVGTYGVASASWWWGRVGALALRLVHYITGVRFGFRFADDFLFLMAAKSGGSLLPFFRILLLMAILEIPLKWAKTSGGFHPEWIGFLFDFEALTVGLSSSRAKWIAGWLDKTASAGIVAIREMMGAIGRVGFAAEVLRHLKPFMAPLYAWMSAGSIGAVLPLPRAIILLMKWIAKQVVLSPCVTLRRCPVHMGEWFRADAKAEGSLVVVGGWDVRTSGGDPSKAAWFSVVLTPETAPWAFCKGLPYRTIAALELFATLLCVVAFEKLLPRSLGLTISLRGITDNQGNQGATRKMMTTRFPLCLILMELCSQLEHMDIELDLAWRRRDENVEADMLTNDDFHLFNKELRIQIDLSTISWKVLPWLTQEAEQVYREIAERKKTRASGPLSKKRRKGPATSLRQTDPW